VAELRFAATSPLTLTLSPRGGGLMAQFESSLKKMSSAQIIKAEDINTIR